MSAPTSAPPHCCPILNNFHRVQLKRVSLCHRAQLERVSLCHRARSEWLFLFHLLAPGGLLLGFFCALSSNVCVVFCESSNARLGTPHSCSNGHRCTCMILPQRSPMLCGIVHSACWFGLYRVRLIAFGIEMGEGCEVGAMSDARETQPVDRDETEGCCRRRVTNHVRKSLSQIM